MIVCIDLNGAAFDGSSPTVHLSSLIASRQEPLRVAQQSDSDAELATHLNLSLAAVKRRWERAVSVLPCVARKMNRYSGNALCSLQEQIHDH